MELIKLHKNRHFKLKDPSLIASNEFGIRISTLNMSKELVHDTIFEYKHQTGRKILISNKVERKVTPSGKLNYKYQVILCGMFL